MKPPIAPVAAICGGKPDILSPIFRFESTGNESSESLCHFIFLPSSVARISKLSIVLLRRDMSNVLRKVLASDSICKVRSSRVSLSWRTSHLLVSFMSASSASTSVVAADVDDATPTNSTKLRIVSHRNLENQTE